jgi:hypothetical protein
MSTCRILCKLFSITFHVDHVEDIAFTMKKITAVTQTSLRVGSSSLYGPFSRTPSHHPVRHNLGIKVIICIFCRSLFVLLYFFFWPLCCLFFFDIRIWITPLVCSNSFFKQQAKNFELNYNSKIDVTVCP